MSENLYDILGVQKSASLDEIKKAYKKLAITHHPDKGGDEETFKKISNAYSILSDEQKRAEYDMGGRMGGQRGGGFSADDFFSQFFRSGAQGFGGDDLFNRSRRKGNSLQYQLDMTLEEIYSGASKKLEFYRDSTCNYCGGNGSFNGNSFSTCNLCRGRGTVLMQHGNFHIENTCHVCNGRGTTISKECNSCKGSGIEKTLTSLLVDIPKGVPSGWKTAIGGYGHFPSGGNGEPGDLYIFVNQLPHKYFERDGNHVVYKAKIPFTKAALGGKIEVPTLEGKRISFDIQECTPSNKLFRLKSQGLPSITSQGVFGDLLVVSEIEMPKVLTEKEKSLLLELNEEENFKN